MGRFEKRRFRMGIRAALLTIAVLKGLPVLAAELSLRQSSTAAPLRATESDLSTIRALLAQGNYRLADTELRRVLDASPGAAEPRFLLGFVLFREQRARESLAAYTEAAKSRSPTPEEFVVIASDYVLLGDYADAQRWLNVAKDRAPQSVSAWYLLGRTEYELDHAAQARDSFLTCLKLDPMNVRAEYNLGLAYVRLQQPEKATEAYEQAIRMTSAAARPDPQPYLNLGILLQSQDKPAQALPLLRNAVELAPKNPSAHEQLALCLERLGRDAEAALEMSKCVQLAPDIAAPSFLLGRIYRRLGRMAEAKEQFERAARLSGTQSSKEVPNPSPDM